MKVHRYQVESVSEPLPKKRDRSLSCLAGAAEEIRGRLMDTIVESCETLEDL